MRGKRRVGKTGMTIEPGPLGDDTHTQFPGRPQMVQPGKAPAPGPLFLRRERRVVIAFLYVLIEIGIGKMFQRVLQQPARALPLDALVAPDRAEPPFVAPEQAQPPVCPSPAETQPP